MLATLCLSTHTIPTLAVLQLLDVDITSNDSQFESKEVFQSQLGEVARRVQDPGQSLLSQLIH